MLNTKVQALAVVSHSLYYILTLKPYPCCWPHGDILLCSVWPIVQAEADMHFSFMPIKILFNFKEWIKTQPLPKGFQLAFSSSELLQQLFIWLLYNFSLCTALMYFFMLYFEKCITFYYNLNLLYLHIITPTNLKVPRSRTLYLTSTEPD